MPSSLLKFVKQYSVKIGGRRYKAVKIGNQLWMAENLDYKFPYNGGTLPIGPSGTPTTPAAWYYDNNEATYGIDGTYKCGLLYNWYAAEYLNNNKDTLLPSGWHVPSMNEWSELTTGIGGASTAGTKLKSLDNSVTVGFPSGWNGTDTYGLKILPAGMVGNESQFVNLGGHCWNWTTTSQSSTAASFAYFNLNAEVIYSANVKSSAYSIRLVKTLA